MMVMMMMMMMMKETQVLKLLISSNVFPIIFHIRNTFHVRWAPPCHHGMARPQVADGRKVSRYGG
jgi:hypothetical protein